VHNNLETTLNLMQSESVNKTSLHKEQAIFSLIVATFKEMF